MRNNILFLSLAFCIIGRAQEYSIVILGEDGNPAQDVVVAESNFVSWMSNPNGRLVLPDSIVIISLFSYTFNDTTLQVRDGDSIRLRLKYNNVDPVTIFADNEQKSVKHRRSILELQREPGDIRTLGYYAQGIVKLDSVVIEVVEVLRPSTRLRVVVFGPDTNRLFASIPFTIREDTQDEMVILPIDFKGVIEGEFYLGVQFLEVGRDPFNWKSHHYVFGRKGTYTHRNSGITIGSIRLRSGEHIMSAEFFDGGQVHWWKGNGSDRRYRAPYLKVYYHGPGEILTDFDDIED
ncbi:MAG: hypothetical protein HWE14_02460 [Flavobacteriia bacterium]|nr:hypothetical protein [Flavobacteriia bacterium]